MDKCSISYCAQKDFTKSSPMTLTFELVTPTSIGSMGSAYLPHTHTPPQNLVPIRQVQQKLLHRKVFTKSALVTLTSNFSGVNIPNTYTKFGYNQVNTEEVIALALARFLQSPLQWLHLWPLHPKLIGFLGLPTYLTHKWNVCTRKVFTKSALVTLTFDLMTPKSIGSLGSIY
jgi:hypothetical protein